MRLEGKIAIITGANGEFGKAITPGFAAEGCDVACVDWTQEDADVAAAAVREKGRRALALAVDSPGHLQALLCAKCSHVSIGASIEPLIGGNPRLFVTWEMLEFTQGTPMRVEKQDRD